MGVSLEGQTWGQAGSWLPEWFQAAVHVSMEWVASHSWKRCSWKNGAATYVSCAGDKGNWKPLEAMNGDIAVAELIKEFWAYSIHHRWVDQEAGCLAVTQRRGDSRSWLASSICLFVWRDTQQGGQCLKNNYHTCEVNCGPLSDTISEGTPWS